LLNKETDLIDRRTEERLQLGLLLTLSAARE